MFPRFSILSNENKSCYNLAVVSQIMTSTTYKILKHYLAFHLILFNLLYLK